MEVPMTAPPEILEAARRRGAEKGLSYYGAVLPREAYELLAQDPKAKLVDVRTRAEWNYVGRIPGAVEIEWQSFPDGQLNPDFITELEVQVPKEAVVLFICRSGARSHSAAEVATAAGYAKSFNVLEGFQGDRNASKHRDSIGGWRVAGLPWYQG
jgi:rhodanese-related sulfurtransferase